MIMQFARMHKRKSIDIINFLKELDFEQFKKTRPNSRIEKVYLDFYYNEFIYNDNDGYIEKGFNSKQTVQIKRLNENYLELGIDSSWHWLKIKSLKEKNKWRNIYNDKKNIEISFEEIVENILSNQYRRRFNQFIENKEEYKEIKKYEKRKVV